MRRHVTPSEPTATIPDPERGDALPPEGRAVDWTPYWAGRLAREEISAHEVADAPVSAAAAPEPEAPALPPVKTKSRTEPAVEADPAA